MKSIVQKYRIPIFLCASGIALALTYQNCSLTKFGHADSEVAYFETAPEKQTEFVVSEKPSVNLKVGIFLDESASMTQIKERVATGVEGLVQRLVGKNAALYFMGISQMGNEPITPMDAPGGLSVVHPAQPLIGSKNATLIKATQVQSIGNAIRSLQPRSVNGGEYGKRAIASVLAMDSTNALFQKGDLGIVVLITDEDEPATAEPSILATRFASVVSESKIMRILAKGQQVRFNLAKIILDGGISKEVLMPQEFVLPVTADQCINWSQNKPALEAAYREKYKFNQAAANEFREVLGCQINNSFEVTYINLTNVSTTDGSEPSCASVNIKVNGTSYADVLAWANPYLTALGATYVECRVTSGYNAINTGQTTQTIGQRISVLTSSSTLNDFIYKRSRDLFGEGNFHFAAVINKSANDPNCSLQTEQKVGQSYIDLAALLKGKTHSICASSYGEVVDGISEFVARTLDGYAIAEARRVNSAQLIKKVGGKVINLVSGIDYRFDGGFFILLYPDTVGGDKIIVKFQ